MSDPIETRLHDYFGRLRPNPGHAAEVRLAAALDRAANRPGRLAVRRPSVAWSHGTGLRRFAPMIAAGVAIVAIAGTYGWWASQVAPDSTAPPSGVAATPSATPAAVSPSSTPSATPAATASGVAETPPWPSDPPERTPRPNPVAPQRGWMTQWRDNAAATLLLDGRVLIAGGMGGDDDTNVDLASAEVFDPKTKTFTATGSMVHSMGRGHTATTLLDGRVLLVAGTDISGMTNPRDAELYDAATGTWTETGQPVDSVWYHVATRLADGRVLVMSGGETQLYDPTTGRFSLGPTAPLSADLALTLTDGRVLVIGGEPLADGGVGNELAALYDPSSGTFTRTGTPLGPIGSGPNAVAGALLADGCIAVAGAHMIQIYDPATGKFRKVANLTLSTRPQSIVALKDGRVLVTYLNDNGRTYWAQAHDFRTGKSVTSRMVESRAMYTTTFLLDGRVLVAGGASDHNVGELFDPSTNQFVGTDR